MRLLGLLVVRFVVVGKILFFLFRVYSRFWSGVRWRSKPKPIRKSCCNMFCTNIFIKNNDVGLKASETSYVCSFVPKYTWYNIPSHDITIIYCKYMFCLLLSTDITSFTFSNNTRNFTVLCLAWTNPVEWSSHSPSTTTRLY